MSKNPFQVIGLAPEALRGRTDDQIKNIVRMLGRALVQIEHPDVGGVESRFKTIQGALDDLENPEKFAAAKNRLLKPIRTERAQLESERNRLAFENRRSRDQFRAYLEAIGSVGDASVLHVEDATLSLIDVIRAEYARGFRPFLPNRETPFVKLIFSSEGRFEERNDLREPLKRILVGHVSKQEVKGNSGIIKLIGTCLEPKTVPLPRLTGRDRAQASSNHRIPLRLAEPILSRLSPALKEGTFLFSITKHMGEPCLYFEGHLLAITPTDA